MSSVFGGISVETPKFNLLTKYAVYEVREYQRQIRAYVTYPVGASDSPMNEALNSPFGKLAGYIFGGNTKQGTAEAEKIEMTAPVVMTRQPDKDQIAMTAPVVRQMTKESGTRTMSFILPSKFTSLDQLPTPKSDEVKFEEVPACKMAAIRFSGLMDKSNTEKQESKLRAAAAADQVKLSSDPTTVQYCSYNPPWCLPFMRTNEILIPVVE